MLLPLLWAAAVQASEYHGQVLSAGSGLPVVGATVTAAQGSKHLAVATDALGVYSFPDLADGSWNVSVEMTGFEPAKQAVAIAPGTPAAKWELKLLSLEQMRAALKPIKAEPLPSGPALAAAAPKPVAAADKKAPPPGIKPAAAADAPVPPPLIEDANAQRASDGLLINGSVNNAATSQYALSQAFGNTRNGRSFYNGGFSLNVDNSAFDAKPFSLSGIDLPKPSFNNIVAGFTIGGPFTIPHVLHRGRAPFFFASYQRTLRGTDSSISALVPTLAQRNGDLTGVQIYSPSNPGTLLNNILPISPQAQALLNFYPLPNVAGNPQYNYEVALANSAHQDAFVFSMNKQLGRKNSFNGGIRWQSARSGGNNLFGFNDKTNTLGLNGDVSWHHNLTPRLWMTTGYTFSRSRTQVKPFFANRIDVSGQAGIGGNDRAPSDWGPPALNFSSGIYPLSDGISTYNRSETNGLSYSIQWNHLRHNVTAGGDFRRQEFNNLQQQNPRGTFAFNGEATASTVGGKSSGGSDVADFLLGIPDTSQIAFGNADKYLRQSVYDAYLNDDWRVSPELTLNIGLRWEYGAPMTELHGRLVNLDLASGFSAEAPVLASSPRGALSGQTYPASLIRPDRSGLAPRLGVAWRPISGSSLLVRAGYGISNDTSVYQTTALAMSQQAPLSRSVSVQNSAACPLTLADGFTPCAGTTADNFAVDPNFRVGYAQTWQLQLQRDLPGSLQMVATYTGIKGTRGVQEVLPNTYPVGGINPCPTCPVGFIYRTSNGNSTREATSLQLRRRLRNGFTASGLYTFSKSLDDDYAYGGAGPVTPGTASETTSQNGQVAQDWLHPGAQRGLSTFDQRHLLSAQVQYTTGMGIGGKTLIGGWKGALYKEWTLLTNITAGSGLPQTALYPATVPGTGYTGIIRADYTGAPIYQRSPGLFLNPNAFAAPAAGQWGNARRDSITGPGRFALNASMSRTFRLHDRYNLDARLDSTNALNHVAYTSYNTVVGSPQFGSAAATGAMRSMSVTMRLRF